MKAGRTVATLAGILVLATAGIASAGPWKRLAQGTDVGPGAVAQAGDLVRKPHRLLVKITTDPSGQQIGAKYVSKCAKGTRVSSRGRRFKGQAPVKRRIRMSFKNPDVCHVSAIASTPGYNRVTIRLFVKK